MKIILELTDNDLKDNTIANSIVNLLKQNKAITDVIDVEPIQDVPVTTDTDREVQKLKDFANGIYKQLNEKSQKSLKRFVEFYTEKIVNKGFKINPKNNWEKWIANDRNLK